MAVQGSLAQAHLRHSSVEAQLLQAVAQHAQAREEWVRAAQRAGVQLADAQVQSHACSPCSHSHCQHCEVLRALHALG